MDRKDLIQIAVIVGVAILVTVGVVSFVALSQKESTPINPINIGSQSKADLYIPAIDISSPDGFINTDPINISDLVADSKVVLLDIWTYSCINCQRTLPYLNAWHEEYADDGLVIIGLHTPEFEFEKDIANVRRAVEKYGIEYPVVLDNDYSTWNAYGNRYWPRKYLIDIDGYVVYDHIGEGGYEETEKAIQAALAERAKRLGEELDEMSGAKVENAETVDPRTVKTPETYIGYLRVSNMANLPSEECFDSSCQLDAPDRLSLNDFALDGVWKIGSEGATLESTTGSIFIKFSANKANLVLTSETSVLGQIYLDGELVGEASSGSDVVSGTIKVMDNDLYNLIDLRGEPGEHLLEIRFLEPGVSAFAFTFG